MEKEEKEQLAIRREALKGDDNFLLSIGFFFTFVVLERGLFVIDVILIALGAYFAVKRSAGIRNEVIASWVKSSGMLLAAYGVAGIVVTLSFGVVWGGGLAGLIVLIAGCKHLGALQQVGNSLCSRGMLQYLRYWQQTYILWSVIAFLVKDTSSVVYISLALTILLAKNHAGMLNDVKLTFFRSVGAEWSAPDDMEDSHYCDEKKVLCVGGVVLGILSVLIADSQLSISVSGLWDVFNKNLGGPALVSPILFVVMFLLYERIDRFVLKVDKGDKSYERSGNMRLLGSVALGLWSFLCLLFGEDANVYLIASFCVILCVVFAYEDTPKEARWLFGVPAEKIEVLIHPQSIVHSGVEFVDGGVKAQLGVPDMKLPIQYAFSYPDRLPLQGDRLDLFRQPLEFFRPDVEKFQCLQLAYESIRKGGNMPCIVNAANEIVNLAFREGRCSFLGMGEVIEKTMQRATFDAKPDYEVYLQTDAEARRLATELLTE